MKKVENGESWTLRKSSYVIWLQHKNAYEIKLFLKGLRGTKQTKTGYFSILFST